MIKRFVLLFPAVLAACSTPLGVGDPNPEGGRVIGVTGIYSERETSEALQAPDSAQVGTTFTVRASSYGSSSCTQPESVAVEVRVRQAELVLYDIVAPRDAVCTQDLRAYPREVELRFDVRGEAVVRLRGRSLYGGTAVTERRITIY